MYDNWIKGSTTKKIPLDEELALIKAAQDGDEKSMEKLLIYYEPFVKQVAKKVAFTTGAKKNEEDLVQHGRIALFEKVRSYSFDYIDERKSKAKGYVPARLSSYAYRKKLSTAILQGVKTYFHEYPPRGTYWFAKKNK